VLKELVDNALDAGARKVSLTWDRKSHSYSISDDGAGVDPAAVPELFAVNRPLLSSKLKRLPTRGMLGNGLRVVMGAVAAFRGSIVVTTRGRRMELSVNALTGKTEVASTPTKMQPGMQVTISLPGEFEGEKFERYAAELSIRIGQQGQHYGGPSQPSWYSLASLQSLFANVVPESTSVGEVVRDIFGIKHADPRLARELTRAEVSALHDRLLAAATLSEEPLDHIGRIGEVFGVYDAWYGESSGVANIDGAMLPYCVEAWASCRKAEQGDQAQDDVQLLVNRSVMISNLNYEANSNGLRLNGCGLKYLFVSPRAKRALYTIVVSLITPHPRLMSDGKTPFLGDFREPITAAVRKAANTAYAMMLRPPKKMSLKDAAYQVMEKAYNQASDNGKLPANARQVMYAARPDILEMTGREKLDDDYFTQDLLPNFVREHPQQCATWDIVYDDRGHFAEPHTNVIIGLGTLSVRGYLGERPDFAPPRLSGGELYPTSGARHRYRNILFVEKEGFDELLHKARIAERYDLSLSSTKGMNNTAVRELFDRLSLRPDELDNVFVLHDFDNSGFSNYGTLGKDSDRYVFQNKEVPIKSLGLRLVDVERLGLQSEPVAHTTSLYKRNATLEEHGATPEEMEFLQDKRVELNAMTSRQFIAFLEQKLEEHGAKKLVPHDAIIEKQARRLLERRFSDELLEEHRDEIEEAANEVKLPRDLRRRVERLLKRQPELPWDLAVARELRGK
jgi:hypothetical protein